MNNNLIFNNMSKSKYLNLISKDTRFEYYGENGNITYAVNTNSKVEYFIDNNKGIVVCVMNTEYGVFKGKATVAAEDKFNLETGMKIARLRATLKLKYEILKEHYEIRDQYRRWLTDEDCTICKYQERIDNIEEELENYKKLQ